MKNAAYFCFLIFTIFNIGKINSKLSKEKLVRAGFEMLPSWQDATDRYCEELEKAKILIRK